MEIKLKKQSEEWIPSNERLIGQKQIMISHSCSTSVSDRTAATVPTFASDVKSRSTQGGEIKEVVLDTNQFPGLEKGPNSSCNSPSALAKSKGLCVGSVYERLSQSHTYSSMNLRKSKRLRLKQNETKRFITHTVNTAINLETKPPLRPSHIMSRDSVGNTSNASVHDRLASQFTKSSFDKRRPPTPIRSASPNPFFTLVKDVSCNSFVEESNKEHRDDKNTLLKASFSDSRKSLSFTSRSSGGNTHNASVHDRLASQFTKSSFDKRRTPTPIRSASPTPFFSHVRDKNSFNCFIEKRDEKIALPPRNSKKLKSLARDETLYRLSKQHTKSSADKRRKLPIPVRYASPKPFYTVVTSGSVSSLSEVTMPLATPTRNFYPSIIKDSTYNQESEEEQTAISEMKKKRYKMQSNIQNLLGLVQANAKYVSSRSSTVSSLHETKKVVESENKRIVKKKDYGNQGDLYTRLMNRANVAAMKNRH